jgi:hypothetical protein
MQGIIKGIGILKENNGYLLKGLCDTCIGFEILHY